MSNNPVISIVSPIYNEVGNIQTLYGRIHAVMEATGESWELILVNDGSTDGSTEALQALYAQDPIHVRVIHFSRNFGHAVAVTAGMDYSSGHAVILIDADLQDPPEMLPDMIRKWREGYEVVYAVRTKREGESWFKLATASLFYRILYRITDVDIPLDTGDFRLMARQVVDVIDNMNEKHRFLRGMVSWVGFRQTGVEYVRDKRYSGETKYPFRKMLRFAWDGITGFSYLPLQLATYLGFAIAALSGLAILLVVYLRAFTNAEPLEGQATTLVVVLFLGSVQLISLGIIGEYLGRIYNEVRGRPLYIVSNVLGIERVSHAGACTNSTSKRRQEKKNE
ncbi:MAG: glycosyltransferase family 2 protein [Anaerolineae bacterium]|nr:glycosyltransferase family 2 protein [Anaerolineae bacterium]